MGATRGSCLCGGVKFELAGQLIRPLNCHCSRCRKQHGAAFRSRVRVKADDFRWLQGESLVKYFQVLAGIFSRLLQYLRITRRQSGYHGFRDRRSHGCLGR